MVTRLFVFVFVFVLATPAAAQQTQAGSDPVVEVYFKERVRPRPVSQVIEQMRRQQSKARQTSQQDVVPVETATAPPPVAYALPGGVRWSDTDSSVASSTSLSSPSVMPQDTEIKPPEATGSPPAHVQSAIFSLGYVASGAGILASVALGLLVIQHRSRTRNPLHQGLRSRMEEFAEKYHAQCVWHFSSYSFEERKIEKKLKPKPHRGEFDLWLKGKMGFPQRKQHAGDLDSVLKEIQEKEGKELPFRIKKVWFRGGWVRIRFNQV